MKKVSVVLLVAILSVGCSYSDIRPETLQQSGITPESERKGRELLARVVEAHGGRERWQSLITADILMRDQWAGGLIGWFNPWPGNNLLVRFQTLVGTFTSRVEILEGEEKGLVWGTQSWHTYEQKPGGVLVFKEVGAAQNLLPAMQYFLELPFRIAKAPLVAHLGSGTLRGQQYERVFATWETPEPHAEHDQYILWINHETGLVELAEWTFRGAMKSYVGTIRYADYRAVEGIQVPFQLLLLKELESTDQEFNHQIKIESVEFNALARAALLPDPSLPFVGDEKPAPN